MQTSQALPLILKYSKKYNLDDKLLYALIDTESGFNEFAIRYEPDYKWLYSPKEMSYVVGHGCTLETMINMQRCSYGICQLMGSNYYELQGKNFATELIDPEICLDYSCKFIQNLIKRQSIYTAQDIYASYNAGAVRRMNNGTLVNQKNVDRFMVNLGKL